METKNYIIGGLSTTLVIISAILGYNITEDKLLGMYGCEDLYLQNSSDAFKVCTDLSAINKDGLQTRCYYDEILKDEVKQTYSVCSTGWKKVQQDTTTTTTEIFDPIYYKAPSTKDEQKTIKFYKNGVQIESPIKHFVIMDEYKNETNIQEIICTQC